MSESKDKTEESRINRADRFKQTTMGQYMDVQPSASSDRVLRSSRSSKFRYRSDFFRKWSDEDTKQYRAGYPGKKDKQHLNENLLFYTNQLRSHPDGDFIDRIHVKWWGDHYRLEQHHGYIQWLFPIRESGMNFYSQELQLHEAKAIIKDPAAHGRILKSYEMMLEFYGMELADRETGQLKRGENWRSRFRHLNSSYHNYLRITRMLKSLGEFNYEHMKKPFVEFVLQEAFEEGTLENTLESCCNYWIGVLKSDEDRKYLLNYIQKMEQGYGTEHPPHTNSDEEESEKMEEYSDQYYVKLPMEDRNQDEEFDSNTGSTVDSDSTADSKEMELYRWAAEEFGEELLDESTHGKSSRILHKQDNNDTMDVDTETTELCSKPTNRGDSENGDIEDNQDGEKVVVSNVDQQKSNLSKI